MIQLTDVNNSQLDIKKVLKAYTRDPYLVEVLMSDNSIKTYKYTNTYLMEKDINKINTTTENKILFG